MAFLASAGCNSGESGKIVLGPSPKISLQPYYAGKVSRVEFHLPHAAGRWGSGGSLQKFGPLPSVCLFQDATRLRHFTFCTDYQSLSFALAVPTDGSHPLGDAR